VVTWDRMKDSSCTKIYLLADVGGILVISQYDIFCTGFSELAEKYGLLKLGGSDFHGRGRKDESDIGTVKLAITTLCCFLKMARPIWSAAMKDILLKFAEDPSSANLRNMLKFGQLTNVDGFSPISAGIDVVNFCLSSWSSNDELEDVELEEVRLKLAHYATER